MVVLSAALCTKQGKMLLSRQFVPMPRMRIEGLLSAFPKLVNTKTQAKKGARQHTFIDTENVRYVFQPLESVYLLMITNKASNIVEDLATLRLFSKVVPEFCAGMISEETILKNAFEIIFAFDEVLSLGYRENITLQQIRTNLEMDSHEEKLHDMIQQSKEQEAKAAAAKKAAALQKERRAREKAGLSSGSSMQGFGNTSGGGGGPGGMGGGSGGMGGGGYGDSISSSMSTSSSYTSRSSSSSSSSASRSSRSTAGSSIRKGGLTLGKKAEKASVFAGLRSSKQKTNELTTSVEAAAPQEPAHVAIEEKLHLTMKQDMSIDEMDVKGSLSLICRDASATKIAVQLDHDAVKEATSTGFQFKLNPKMDKTKFSSNAVLSLKNLNRGFPVDKAAGVLKWRLSSADESHLPLSINCWPEMDGKTCSVSTEYTLENTNMTLQEVIICIPLPRGCGEPQVERCEHGSHRFNSRKGYIEWQIDLVDEKNSSGSLEFSCGANDESEFFPLTINFASMNTIAGVVAEQVADAASGNAISFSSASSFEVDHYTVEFE